jgi:hypothetical protein
MNENTHIDKIFKDNIGEMHFSNTDAMWQKMDRELNKDQGKKKRRFAFVILFTALLTTGFFIARNLVFDTHARAADVTTVKTGQHSKDIAAVQKNDLTPDNRTVSSDHVAARTPVPVKNEQTKHAGLIKKAVVDPAIEAGIEMGGTDELNDQDNIATDDFLKENMPAQVDPVIFNHIEKLQQGISLLPAEDINAIAAVKPTRIIEKKNRRYSVEGVAGRDILRVNRKAGYYAGIRVNKFLEKNAFISVGINYTNNGVNDEYRLSSKPSQLKEADAALSEIRMIRMPVYFGQQMGKSKFTLMAGLIPSYVTKATFYNLYNSFTGNPNGYRKFTIDEMNRFNVLFGVGIKYAPEQRFAFELSGSYGLTGLVKNSYINQSRINDNFKSIQAGIVLKLK